MSLRSRGRLYARLFGVRGATPLPLKGAKRFKMAGPQQNAGYPPGHRPPPGASFPCIAGYSRRPGPLFRWDEGGIHGTLLLVEDNVSTRLREKGTPRLSEYSDLMPIPQASPSRGRIRMLSWEISQPGASLEDPEESLEAGSMIGWCTASPSAPSDGGKSTVCMVGAKTLVHRS